MPKFLIVSPHEAEELLCARIIHDFLATGSHFLTHADWGCQDGVHTGWIFVDAASKEEARMVLPPTARPSAKIVALNKFTMEYIESVLKKHER